MKSIKICPDLIEMFNLDQNKVDFIQKCLNLIKKWSNFDFFNLLINFSDLLIKNWSISIEIGQI